MVNFIKQNKNPIVCCIVDNRDLYQSSWATEVSINISDFLIHRFNMQGYDIFIGKDEDALLKEVSTEGYSHAVIIAMGMSLGLNDKLFPAIEKLCQQEFFVAGHVLQRNEKSYYQNAYYELHHQFYIVRLADYVELGCPSLGQPEEIVHTQIEPIRSEECLYGDHEVAAWIKPGTIEKTYNMKMHGWNLISTALKNNKVVVDLGPDIRESKKYLYYEYDHVFLRQVSDIYYNQFFCNNFIPSWNSDQFKESIPFEGPVEQYITVGIGVFWITYLDRITTTPDTKVIFTDINHSTLQFMKAMVEEWDGENYSDFYDKHRPITPNNFSKDINAYVNWTRDEWDKFIVMHPNWKETWAKIKQLKFEYILIDYMASYNLDWIVPGKKTLINLSDVFTHSPYVATQSLKYRISCENKLITKIQNVDPNITIIMTSRASDGYLTRRQTLTGFAKDFELTDINELKKAPWHSKDWVSIRPLG
jgi:hypothetical protein